MLKNRNFKIFKLGDYNNVIITRGKFFKDLKEYSLENRENFYSLNNNLHIYIGKKLIDLIVFNTGTNIIDIERYEGNYESYFYGDIRIINLNQNAAYSEFNAPFATKIEKDSVIISMVNSLGYKAICKIDLFQIDKLRNIISKLENNNSEIKILAYCIKESIIPIKKIVEFKENIKKFKINEELILKYEIEKGYVVDIPKLIFEICSKAEEIKIIKHLEEDINNIILFI